MPESGALLPAALGGVATGGVYALLAAALALIHGKLRLIDFGHAVGLLLAVFGLTFLILNFGIDPVASLPFAAAVGLAGGVALKRGRAMAARASGDPLFLAIAFLVAVQFTVLQQWGGAVSPWTLVTVSVGFDFEFQPVRAIALFAGLLGCGVLAETIVRTDFGRGVQTVVAGGSPGGQTVIERIEVRAFAIAGICLSVGACLLVPSNGVQVQTVGGFLPIVLALAVLGARGNLRDALSGGLLIGLVESVGRASLGDERGLLCVVAVALALLLGYTGRLVPPQPYLTSELQKR
jgi:branched-chain amino acid transport system permease protein